MERSYSIGLLSAGPCVRARARRRKEEKIDGQRREKRSNYCLAVCDLLLDSIDWFPLSRFFFLNFREPVRNPTTSLILSHQHSNYIFIGRENAGEESKKLPSTPCPAGASKRKVPGKWEERLPGVDEEEGNRQLLPNSHIYL